MSTMNKILIGLAIVQLGVLLAVRLIGGDSQGGEAPPHPLIEFDPATVTRIEIQDGPESEPLVLERRDGDWVIASADGFPAKAEKIWDEKGVDTTALLNRLSDLRVSDPVLTRSESHAVAKVAADAFEKRVLLKDGDGKTVAEIFVAAIPGSMGSFYVRSAGGDEVFQSDTLTSYALSTSTTSWVEDTSYVKWPKDEVTRLRVIRQDAEPVVLVAKTTPKPKDEEPEKSEDESTPGDETQQRSWSVADSDVELDGKKVEEFLGRICSITLEDVLGTKAPAELDPQKPLVTVEVTFEEKDTRTLAIVGKQKNDFVVKASTSPFFVRVYAWSLEKAAAFDLEDLMAEKKKEEESPSEKKPDGDKEADENEKPADAPRKDG